MSIRYMYSRMNQVPKSNTFRNQVISALPLEFSMRGIQSLDHLNGCNKRVHRNRRHPTLNTPDVNRIRTSLDWSDRFR